MAWAVGPEAFGLWGFQMRVEEKGRGVKGGGRVIDACEMQLLLCFSTFDFLLSLQRVLLKRLTVFVLWCQTLQFYSTSCV